MSHQFIETNSAMKTLDAAILTLAFVYNALVLDADWQSLAVAIGGSVSGAIILAYFRREARKGEQMIKVIASAIGGLVLGAVLQKYLNIESVEYRLGLFFACSMLALVVLRSLLSLTENNVAELIRGVLQRVFNLRVETEKVKKRVRHNEEKIAELEHKKEGE